MSIVTAVKHSVSPAALLPKGRAPSSPSPSISFEKEQIFITSRSSKDKKMKHPTQISPKLLKLQTRCIMQKSKEDAVNTLSATLRENQFLC